MIQFGVKFDTFCIRVQTHFKFLTGCWPGMTGRGINWVGSWQNCTLEVHLWSFVCPWTPWGCMVSYLSFCISEGCSSAPSKHFCHPALTWTLLLIVTRQFMQHSILRNADSEDWQSHTAEGFHYSNSSYYTKTWIITSFPCQIT